MAKTLQAYSEVVKQCEKLREIFDDQNIYRNTLATLKSANDFCSKYKIQALYRLAMPGNADADKLDKAGIEIGKVNLPKTLLKFLLSKCKEDKPSKLRLLGMIMHQQKFNVAFSGNRLRILIGK